MKGFARPSAAEERWLALQSVLGSAVDPAVLAERTGGWRTTGPLARIALFVLGAVAVALVYGVLGFGGSATLLIAGLVTAVAAEVLAANKRLYASGIEEGLCLGGWLMLGAWFMSLVDSVPGFPAESLLEPVLIITFGAAGLRLLNPIVTTAAAVTFVHWIASTGMARAADDAIGGRVIELVVGCSLAALALVASGRTFQRPSYDRMLAWLVAVLPITSYWPSTHWYVLEVASLPTFGTGRFVTIMLLLALGVAMLVAGVRRRRHAPLLGFMGCVVCIALELRLAVALPTEAWLIGYGLVALATGLALDRYLRSPRHGFTSASISSREGPLDLLQTAGAAVLTGSSTASAPRPEPEFAGEGGRFGGGGASGSY